MKNGHVVVGVDGSPVSVRALDRAAGEAASRGCALRIVYAVTDLDGAAPVLDSALARVAARRPDLPVETEAVEGGAVRALVRAGADAALVVVGHRDLGPLTGRLAGSVSLRLAACPPAPLLVVRGDHPAREGGDVLLGLEDDADTEVAAHAFEEAERRAVRLRILHSVTHRHVTFEMASPIPGTSPGQRRLAEEDRSEEAVPRFAVAALRHLHPLVDVDLRTVRTAPTHALPEATREAAVVVVGARRGHRPVPEPGPVVRALLHHSHCPVLVVPKD
ncbi:universal stress protein [Streptomyces sp. NPDC026672]|uniref:universal stress protein n=1 Tax=unclassified Streptomyces TaxID=2593676 RepID=UPI0033E8956D